MLEKMKSRSLVGYALALLIPAVACPAEPESATHPRSLAHIPIMQELPISVGATGFQQVERHIEFAALVKNSSQALDASECGVTFAAFDTKDELLGQQTVEPLSIPSNMTTAVTGAVDLASDTKVSYVRAFVFQSDAPVPKANRPPLTATDIKLTVDPDGTISVIGRILSRDMHPGPHRIDAVVIDSSGAIVGSARLQHLDPDKGQWTQFVAKGRGRAGTVSETLSAIVTVLPDRAEVQDAREKLSDPSRP